MPVNLLTATHRFVLWNPPLSNFAAQTDPSALVPDTTGCLPIRKSRAKKRATSATSTAATAASGSDSAKRSKKGAAALTSAEAAEVRGARPIVAQDNHYDRFYCCACITFYTVCNMSD
jgi:hypothetical protein